LSRADDLRLDDIREAADRLAEIVGGGRDEFDRDWTRQRATERLLEIIGVASASTTDTRHVRSSRPG
jgi:uncharacterized protein with HEPN domain